MPVPPKSYRATIELQDHAGKNSRTVWNISSTDYAAYLVDYTTGAVRTLIDAYMALSLDNKISEEVAQVNGPVIGAQPVPSSENAVNSAKLIILGRDGVSGKAFKQELPARDATKFTSVKGEVNLAGTAVAAYVTASNATKLSEDGNATAISQIKVAGKGTQA